MRVVWVNERMHIVIALGVLDQAALLIARDQRAGRRRGWHLDDLQIADGRKDFEHRDAQRKIQPAHARTWQWLDQNLVRGKTVFAQPRQIGAGGWRPGTNSKEV